MAVDTYSNLKRAVIDFTGRDDLSSRVDDFILLCEDSMYNNDVSPLRVTGFETTAALTLTAGTKTVALPADFMQARAVTVEYGGNDYPLNNVSPVALDFVTGSGLPTEFSTFGDNLKFNRTADGEYTINISYYAKPTALSSSNPTNSVLTKYPTIYLHGCLSEAYKYAGEVELSEHYFTRMLSSIRGANRSSRDVKRSPTASARIHGSTP